MKKILVFITISLLILNGFLIYKLKNNNKVLSKAINILANKKAEAANFSKNFYVEKSNENLQISEATEFIDIDRNTIPAKEVFKQNTLVLRYSENNCKDCINTEINNLLKLKDSISEICLLAHYKEKRDLYVFSKEFEKKGLHNIRMYLVPEFGLHLPIEKLNKPYYFCVDSSLRITNFFIPQLSKPKLSDWYLKTVNKNFLSKKK